MCRRRHRSSGSGCSGSRQAVRRARFGRFTGIVTGVLAAFAGCGGTEPEQRAAVEEWTAAPVRAVDCPACADLARTAGPDTAAWHDPHHSSCAACHHPDGLHQAGHDWLPTSGAADCHPRAWTRTTFHRVEPAVFRDCTNCHQPHTWQADAQDCRSCHGPDGTPVARAGLEEFPHERHADLDCVTCHPVGGGHAAKASLTPTQCQSCHHGPPPAAACGDCHEAGPPGVRRVSVAMRLSGSTPARQRQLGFDHARHAGVACSSCHRPPIDGGTMPACAECHGDHASADLVCHDCHSAPPAGVHDLAVHEGGCAGSGCHAKPLLTSLPRPRELCLSCHVEQLAHQPGGACASCHLVPLGHGGGS